MSEQNGRIMITAAQKKSIHTKAVVPEHLVELMTLVSKGEACLVDDYLCFAGKEWLILIGYPLGSTYDRTAFESEVDRIIGTFRSKQAWILGPDLPVSVKRRAVEMEEDFYYRLNLEADVPVGRLARTVETAGQKLHIEHASQMTPHHHELTVEFSDRASLHPRVRELAFSMPEYVSLCPESLVLNAWDRQGRLAGFYVADFSANRFATYVIGCYSKKNYTTGTSDLLMKEMILLSRQKGKEYIHLGLGVNPGIRRFKEKWGGFPAIKYEMVKILGAKPSILEVLAGKT